MRSAIPKQSALACCVQLSSRRIGYWHGRAACCLSAQIVDVVDPDAVLRGVPISTYLRGDIGVIAGIVAIAYTI